VECGLNNVYLYGITQYQYTENGKSENTMEPIGFILIGGLALAVWGATKMGADHSREVCEEANPGEFWEVLREGLSEDSDSFTPYADDEPDYTTNPVYASFCTNIWHHNSSKLF